MTSSAPPRRVVPLAPRRQAEEQAARRARRDRRLRLAGYGGLSLLPLGVLGWLALSSPLLDVDEVAVTGTAALPARMVAETAAVPRGSALVAVDLDAARARVAALPRVASVEVVRDWPGTVRVTVVERVPVAVVAGADGTRRLVDADGTAYAEAGSGPDGVPPTAVELRVDAPSAGDPATRAALAVVTDLPPALRDRLAWVAASSPTAVELGLDGGRRVLWGAPGGTAEKAGAVLALDGKPGEEVDVTTPGVAVVR